MTIRVLSFDFDGCLFHSNYCDSKEKNVVNSNKVFLNRIKKENKKFTKTYTLVGSNRQSFYVDRANSDNKGSCFHAVKKVSDFLGTTLDTFLLSDIFGNLPEGTSYARVTDKDYTGEHSDWLFDDTKVTIMYAQMHKIAKENPNEEIIFDFYDDRGNGARAIVDILEKLQDFYNTHSDLIPTNVTLRLHQYAGMNVTPVASIKGTGFIDENYRQTVQDLSQQAVTQYNDGIRNPIYVYKNAKPELLQNRKAFLVDIIVNDSVAQTLPLDFYHLNASVSLNEKDRAAKAKFTDALKRIAEKADKFDEMQSDAYSYKKAATAARDLHDAISTASKKYFNDHDKVSFRQAADDAIGVAINSELKNHRGHLKEILGYAGLAILTVLTVATAGLAYAIAGGINYAINRQFFFSTKFNTDSVNRVLDLQEAVDGLATPAA